jgi:glycine oxidase
MSERVSPLRRRMIEDMTVRNLSPTTRASVTAGGLYALLEAARRTFPAIEEMAVEAVWTGFRPSSLDDAPVLGTTTVPGLVIATGHHRNGYLLTPVTASAIEALITDGAMPAVAHAFGLDRFWKAVPELEYAK